MATITKRNNRYSVVYRYKDKQGNTKQKWETFDTAADAKRRKAEIELEISNKNFVPPSEITVNELLDQYIKLYGVNKWSLSTYDSNIGLMNNYIRPIIGRLKVQDITPLFMDRYYRQLERTEAAAPNNKGHGKISYLTANRINGIHRLLRSVFNQAIKWEIIAKNPVQNANLPKAKSKKREIWDIETLTKALSLCEDEILKLAINLSFSCTLRIGELLGLTWDCVDISTRSLEKGIPSIQINKELQRVNIEVAESLNEKDILFTFPKVLSPKNTKVVLKTPKTENSIRKVFLPKTVANMLVERKKDLKQIKELMGDEFTDFDLVFCNINGRPMDSSQISRMLKKLIRDNNLPDVVFHSFRHASITYKLLWNNGDIKSVQGDSGHTTSDMITDVYSHILDGNRRHNANEFEKQFYQFSGFDDDKDKPNDVSEISFKSGIKEIKKGEMKKQKVKKVDIDDKLKKLSDNPEKLAILNEFLDKLLEQ